MRSLDLYLHCGANKVNRNEVLGVATPAHTETWYPIGHGTVLGAVERQLESSGLQVVTEAHAITNGGMRYFGLLQVAYGENGDGDYGMVIGVRNTHDQSFAAGICCGAGVFVCDNLSFSSEVRFDRKHTRFIARDLPKVVASAVGKLADMRTEQADRIELYQETELQHSQAHDLVIGALDAGVVPASHVPKVLEQWRHPKHPEFAAGGLTAWRLENAFTEVLKTANIMTLPKRSQRLHGILDHACQARRLERGVVDAVSVAQAGC